MSRFALLLLALVVTCTSRAWGQVVEADLVIRGGTIHDGSDRPPVVGDVAIKGEKIVAVGKFEAKGTPEIFNAAGMLVAPGFIDLHNHSDSPIVDEKTRAAVNYLRQGCTTIVTGNCGGGVVDVAAYFKKLEANPPGVNVAHLMPHGAIRGQAVGWDNRPAKPEELQKMRDLVDKGMRDGAIGMSTGLIYTPGMYGSTEEIIELAKIVRQHGGIYASHMRNESTQVLEAIEEALRIGRESGAPVHISHFKASGPPAWGLSTKMVEKVNAARAAGLLVTADQYPYIASSTSLEATIAPDWARDGGRKRFVERLNDPETGKQVMDETLRALARRGGGQRIVIARAPSTKDASKIIGKNLLQASDAAGKPLHDFVKGLLLDGGVGIVNFGMSDEDMRRLMQETYVATASDGSAMIPNDTKPHPRSYGTFPAKIGRYAHRQKWVGVDQAIRSSSGLPADILGLKDRGYLRPGYFADVVVIDLENFIDKATYTDPHQYSVGLKRVYVAGQAAVIDDEATGKNLGRPIRYTSTAAAR